MQVASVPFVKKTPFLRLLPALAAGILLHWFFQPGKTVWCWLAATGFLLSCSLFFFRDYQRLKLSWLNSIAVLLLFGGLGGLLAFHKDIRNTKNWIGHQYTTTDALLVTLDEPSVEKTKSVKANAETDFIIRNDSAVRVKGKIILYFKKDSIVQQLSYGTRLILKKPLQEIKNAGNPGGFDYKRYCLFQGITHQVYLQPGDYELLDEKQTRWLKQFIYDTRSYVLGILRKHITTQKELGLAEALLIGYKDDLDQSLVQSYTNTGVVHVIAISGLHLGLLYWLFVRLLRPVAKRKRIKWLAPVCIIAGLWLFTLLAGAQPSVLRSAVMFSCIVVGENLGRRSSIFNTLALSAFILLCINPYWLWDVGFQLSYAAVASIVLFMKPVYNLLYFPNKALDFIWKMNAVTLAAQIFTTPVSIYHFHQFPNYFLLTNFVAVPLSSIILIAEILLCIISFWDWLAAWVGKVSSFLIRIMNSYIEQVEKLAFSLWNGLQLSVLQTILVYLFLSAIAYWLLERSKPALRLGLTALLGFVCLRSYSFIESGQQKKIIVYNVPQKPAMDFIDGRHYLFAGDPSLQVDGFERNFHLNPSRILYRTSEADSMGSLAQQGNSRIFFGKKILLINSSTRFTPQEKREPVDLLIISGNPKLYITDASRVFDIKQVVADGSAPAWKTRYWQADCDSLHIPFYDVKSKGAFVMSLR